MSASSQRQPTNPRDYLPPGVTPRAAGRAWAWIWRQGRRNHANALRRTTRPLKPYERAHPCIASLIGVWLPYRISEYPGYTRALADVCGVPIGTAAGWLRRYRVPHPSAVMRLQALAAERVAAWSALEVELAELLEVSRRRKIPPHKDVEKRGG